MQQVELLSEKEKFNNYPERKERVIKMEADKL